MTEYLKNIIDLTPYINTKAFCGIRVNPIRLSRAEFEKIAPFEIRDCEFYEYGYYINDEDKTGKHPLHSAGAYYIQEPSAMSAVRALDVKKGDRVLDACAAPGSKATAIAPHCDILVANEINGGRAQALIGNIERMGISNALVLNTDTAALPSAFAGYFDKVLVDSPCSGEGMFRKHPEILTDWTPELVKLCAERSKTVLKNAAACLKEGGRLVYSTCTYNLEENEKVIIDFLENNPDFEVCDTGLDFGDNGFLGLDKARRISVKHGGEGHFVCALTRVREGRVAYPKPFKLKGSFANTEGIIKKDPTFTCNKEFGFMSFQGTDYAVPFDMPCPKDVHILRAGVKLGGMNGKVWKPEHHMFMASKPCDIINCQEVDESTVLRFLKGEEIECESTLKGYCAVCYRGLTVGFGKASGGRLKNHLPKGLRF